MRIKVHPSTVIFAVLLVTLDGSIIALIPFAAALCHELGHLIVMRITGNAAASLEITLFGAQICALPTNAGMMCSVAIYAAGAAANLISAAGVALIPYHTSVSEFFIACSLSLAVINLLPIRSLDGGCILESVLIKICPVHAYTICTVISAVTLIMLWLIAVYLLLLFDGNISLMLFCIYLFTTLFLRSE